MTKSNPFKAVIILGLAGAIILGPAQAFSSSATYRELYDSLDDDSVEIVVGEIQTVTVYSPTRISLANPKIADIVKMEGKEVILAGKTPGSTTLNVWDKYGQRSMIVRVIEEDLERVKSRLEGLLSNMNIRNLSLDINKAEGKIILKGDVLTTDKGKFDNLIDPLRNKIISLVNIADEDALVQIDVQILELSKSVTDTLGLAWFSALTFSETSASAAANLLNAARVFTTKNWTRDALSIKLNLAISEGKGRVLARPKLVSLSGKEASFLVGGQIPILTSSTSTGGNVTQNVEFRDYGVNLRIKPTVKSDGKIDITLTTEVSNVDDANSLVVSGVTYPGFATRTATTQLYLEDGQTVFLAGLIKNDESDVAQRLPAVSKLPIIGPLFRSKTFKDNQTELVVSLTPTIIRSKEKETELKLAQAVPAVRETALKPITRSIEEPLERDTATLKELPGYLVEYAHLIQEKISSAAEYPEEARQLGWEGAVRLNLRILSDGTLSEAKIKQSSGFEIFDDSAIATAKNQSPYPAFPVELRAREINLEVPVIYNLNSNQ